MMAMGNMKMVQNNMRFPYDVIVSRNENEGFGFVIISATNQYYGSTIGKEIRWVLRRFYKTN